ncbi:MAG: MBL fold metallo-hydrolase [Bdellovibrionales bacterium]|nr:MBL fold metallo-hydrolase [Bdellovibrionales bacterium]
MRIKFHGVRGSNPIAVSQVRIDEISRYVWEFTRNKKFRTWRDVRKALAAGPRAKYQVFGGASTCLELKTDLSPIPIFFDAGSGLTSAGTDKGSALMNSKFRSGKGRAAFFITHTHWDHIMGLFTIDQIFQAGNKFTFYGVHKDLDRRLATLFQPEFFPVPFEALEDRMEFKTIPLHSSVRLGKLNITHFPQSHPGGSFAYRIDADKKSLIFATDTSLKNVSKSNIIPGQNFYSNADVLIIDAHFSPEDYVGREDWGHAEIHGAVDFAVREGTKKLYLFHQSPQYNDIQIEQQLHRSIQYHRKKFGKNHPLEIHMAIEGDEIKI